MIPYQKHDKGNLTYHLKNRTKQSIKKINKIENEKNKKQKKASPQNNNNNNTWRTFHITYLYTVSNINYHNKYKIKI